MIIPFQVPLFCKYASPCRSSFMPFIQNMHVCNSDADFWMHSQNPFNLEYLTKQIFYPLIKKRRHRIIIAWWWNDNMTIYNGIVFEEHNAQDWRHTNYTLFLPFFLHILKIIFGSFNKAQTRTETIFSSWQKTIIIL